MAGINEFHEARFLRETLKEQVSVSIREALEKTTSVLSNLHRVQSYLDLIKSVPISRSEAGAKNALEQIRMVREDAATLLQTVCLSEIGLQSLQNYDRQGGASTDASSMMPIFGDTINITPTVPINSNDPSQDSSAEGLIMGLSSADDSLSFVDPSGSVESSLPPTKKPYVCLLNLVYNFVVVYNNVLLMHENVPIDITVVVSPHPPSGSWVFPWYPAAAVEGGLQLSSRATVVALISVATASLDTAVRTSSRQRPTVVALL